MSSQTLAALFPVMMALNAALFFSLAVMQQNIGLSRGVDPRDGTTSSMLSTALVFWVCLPFYVESWYWWHSAIFIFMASGLIRPFVSANLAMLGLKHLGPTLSSTLTSTSPLFGAFIGVVIFGETMTLEVFIATCVIVAGVVILAQGRGGIALDARWPLWALALPVGAAIIRSLVMH